MTKELEKDFPYLKDFGEGKGAYISPLTFGRARICTIDLDNPFFYHDFY